MASDRYEPLPEDCWISWTWAAYFGLEWWQRCRGPREVQ